LDAMTLMTATLPDGQSIRVWRIKAMLFVLRLNESLGAA
jgi:hypothetical protein